MSDVVKISVRIRTDKIGSDCEEVVEFDREDWEAMSEEERVAELLETVWSMAEWNWSELE